MKSLNNTIRNLTNPLTFKFYGEGGQGIKYLVVCLANILTGEYKLNAAINFRYDSSIKGGDINADLIISNKPILSPIVENADYCLILDHTSEIVLSRNYIVESSVLDEVKNLIDINLKKERSKFNIIQTSFIQKALEIGLPNYVNIIALGTLIRLLDISPTPIKLKQVFKGKREDMNLKAFNAGYETMVV